MPSSPGRRAASTSPRIEVIAPSYWPKWNHGDVLLGLSLALECQLMSRNGQSTARQPAVPPPVLPRIDYDIPRAIITFARDLPGGVQIPLHIHPRGQLLYSSRGTVTTCVEDGNWVAPPERAIWVPAGVPHATRHSVGSEVRNIFVRMDAAPGMPERCAVVQVGPLLRELLLAVMRLPPPPMAGSCACCSTALQRCPTNHCTCRCQ